MDKRSWILIGIIVLMLGIIFSVLIWHFKPHKPALNQQDNPTQTNDPKPSEEGPKTTTEAEDVDKDTDTAKPDEQTKSQKPKTQARTSQVYRGHGYDATLNSYRKSGYILQFDGCKLATTFTGSTFNMGKGAKFALLNAGSGSRTYKLFGKSYTLAQADYVVFMVEKNGIYSVICDGTNAASIHVN